MLQLQYITRLKNKHINNILDNYKLKYSGMKNEIDTKINELIKLFLKDILAFLENLEQTATNKKKINNYDKMKTELESIRNQLKIKTYNEHKAKNELDLLAQENSLLKVKIKSLNQKILNLSNNLSNSNNNLYNIRNKSPLLCRRSVKNKTFMSSGIDIRGNLHNTSGVILNYAKKKTSSVDNTKMRTENDKDNYNLDFSSGNIKNTFTLKNNRKPNLNIRRKSLVNNRKDRINIKLSLKKQKNDNNNDNTNPINQKKKKINFNKFVNNPANNNTNNANNTIKNNDVPSTPGPILSAISNIMINGKKERNSSSKSNKSNPKELKSSNYSPNNSFELLYKTNTDYEEIGKNINSVLDDELKQLEIDEENINKLLEQINCEDFDNIILKKNSKDSNFSLKDE